MMRVECEGVGFQCPEEDADRGTGRSILVITRHFFPDLTVGAVRVTEWCRQLPELGWRPTVITGGAHPLNRSRDAATQLKPSVEVVDLGQPSTSRPRKKSLLDSLLVDLVHRGKFWIERLQPFVPDPGVGGWRRREARVMEVVERVRPDVVITTSPPHGIHLLGMAIKDGFPNISWVADFRDPYLIDERYAPRVLGRFRAGAHRAFEASVYEKATLVIHAIPIHYRHARLAYPEARQRMRLLTNGTPPSLLLRPSHGAAREEGRFRVVAVGNVDAVEAASLARAMAGFVSEGRNLELRLVGPDPLKFADLAGLLGDRLVAPGRVSHQEALDEISEADVLVSLTGRSRARGLQLSSKLFEYLALPVPVIVVNPTNSDAAFLRSRPGIIMARSPSGSEWREILNRVLDGQVRRTPAEAAAFGKEFARRDQVRTLIDWLDVLPAAWNS